MEIEYEKKYVEAIDKQVKNIQKLCLLPKTEREELAKKVGIEDSFDGMLNLSINSMLAYKTVLKERIKNEEIDT